MNRNRSLLILTLLIGAALLYLFWQRGTGIMQAESAYQLPHELVTRLYELHAGGGDRVDFFCRALEGSECFVLTPEQAAAYDFRYNAAIETEAARIDRAIASELLKSLDVKRVERARNNTLLIRCQRDSAGRILCEANPGGGEWLPVNVT